ncbi:MAG: ion channel [Cyclobacteriaceae bacterium]|nr:ion channel [Cyclobacteriaceae bacterium]
MKKPSIVRYLFYLGCGLVVYSILLFLLMKFEIGQPESQISNIKDAIWYSVVTLTTVGYGDIVPKTPDGRLVGSIFILFSMGVYGLLIGQAATIINSIKENRKLGMNGTNFECHVVIIGWTDFGKAVTDQLVAAGRKVAIVTKEKDNVDIIQEYYSSRKVFVLFNDYNNIEMLDKVNIKNSSTVFINLNDDTEKLVYILNLKKHYNSLTFIVTLDNANLKNTFMTAGVTYAISRHEISSKLLASYIFEPDVATYSEEIISFASTDDDHDIKQFYVTKDNPYKGMPYIKVFFDLKKSCNAVLIGIVKNEKGKRTLYKNPHDEMTVQMGDYLIMISNGKSEGKISKLFHTKEGL